MRSQLEATESELEKQHALNEKLETDLLQMDQRKDGGINGASTPANGTGSATPVDVLAGLDLGKKSGVGFPCTNLTRGMLLTERSRKLRRGTRRYHLLHQPILQSYRLLQASGIASGSATQNLRKYALIVCQRD